MPDSLVNCIQGKLMVFSNQTVVKGQRLVGRDASKQGIITNIGFGSLIARVRGFNSHTLGGRHG